ncbi:hypothetical protein C8R45DRAFT_940080 [Mycena sanguinolenta]|nr:hypothetical protein C8R45DRAFT_940080 [Mycena sanguinolenta]
MSTYRSLPSRPIKVYRVSLYLGRTEVENTTGTQYSLKETDPKDWCAAFRTELANTRPDIDQIMDEDRPVSNEQLEQAAWALTNAMHEVTVKVGKVRRPNMNAKPWWNNDLATAADNMGKAQTELQEFEASTTSRSRHLRAKAKKAVNFFKHLCKATKAKWAIEKLQEAQTGDI